MNAKFVANNNHVRMLLCGPTVCDYIHVGHARMLLFYDLMARYFLSRKMRVTGLYCRYNLSITREGLGEEHAEAGHVKELVSPYTWKRETAAILREIILSIAYTKKIYVLRHTTKNSS